MSEESTDDKQHLEARVWVVISRIILLWLDRFAVRMVPLSIVAFVAVLFSDRIQSSGGLLITTTIIIASVWAIADLARGIELDHQEKDATLRDSILQSQDTDTNHSE